MSAYSPSSQSKMSKRDATSQPTFRYVESLAVIDSLGYKNYQTFFPGVDDDMLFEYIQIYLATMINAVSILVFLTLRVNYLYWMLFFKVDFRYAISFANDSQLRISVKLKNVLLFKVSISRVLLFN